MNISTQINRKQNPAYTFALPGKIKSLGTSNNLLRKPDRLLRCSAYPAYASAPQIRCGPLATVIRSSPFITSLYLWAFPGKKALKTAWNKRLRFFSFALMSFLILGSSACGFRFRGVVQMAYPSVAVQAAPASQLANDLRRQLAAVSNTSLLNDAATAALRVEVLNESREKEVLSVNAQGRVREYTLYLRVKIRALDAQGNEVLPPTDFVQKRDISFNEGVVLAKESEDNLLYREMQNEIVQLILRRIAALQPLATKS